MYTLFTNKVKLLIKKKKKKSVHLAQNTNKFLCKNILAY